MSPGRLTWTCRILMADDAGYGFFAPGILELTIAVLPGRRGKGAGTALMVGLIGQAQPAVCGLSASALKTGTERGDSMNVSARLAATAVRIPSGSNSQPHPTWPLNGPEATWRKRDPAGRPLFIEVSPE